MTERIRCTPSPSRWLNSWSHLENITTQPLWGGKKTNLHSEVAFRLHSWWETPLTPPPPCSSSLWLRVMTNVYHKSHRSQGISWNVTFVLNIMLRNLWKSLTRTTEWIFSRMNVDSILEELYQFFITCIDYLMFFLLLCFITGVCVCVCLHFHRCSPSGHLNNIYKLGQKRDTDTLSSLLPVRFFACWFLRGEKYWKHES